MAKADSSKNQYQRGGSLKSFEQGKAQFLCLFFKNNFFLCDFLFQTTTEVTVKLVAV
jgi:hypothetical protein